MADYEPGYTSHAGRMNSGPIQFASRQLSLDDTEGQGLPLVFGEDGLSEPITIYLYLRRRNLGDLAGSLAQAAYVLRAFMAWLREVGVDWLDATDSHLAQWVHLQGALQGKRLRWKAFVLFDFYLTLQDAGYLRLFCGVASNIVGEGPAFPIQARSVERVERTGGGRRVGSRMVLEPVFARPFSTSARRSGRRRVPCEEETAAVLAELCGHSRTYIGARNWFFGAFMAFVGLRREGVASLAVHRLVEALALEGLHVPVAPGELTYPKALEGKLSALELLAYWPDGQDRLIQRLKNIGRYRDYLYLKVVEKGQKERKVEVPVDLFCSVLRIWIWDLRASYLEECADKRPGWKPPSELWLSRRTKAGMRGASIGNALKKAFNAITPPGVASLSGHRLRAYYLTQLIRRLYRKELAVKGRLVDVKAILLVAAELAGHEHWESLRCYVDMEALASIALEGQAILVADPKDAEMVRGLSLGLGSDVPGLREALRGVSQQYAIQDVPEPHTARDAVSSLQRLEKLQQNRRSARGRD